MTVQKPTIGQIVHYVSYGTPGGAYSSTCRAAVVTEINSQGADEAWRVGLAVLNPEGMFFNRDVPHSNAYTGGTWHVPAEYEG